ncbi:hypothetical protein H4R22_000691 [Coemansia sp. RSA 1290]|nr:hypothetical protein LPJ79_004159 [Coemansia sp. RSA 1821]KAJ2633190.1 hypothetical protein H4R22_000691 [Coemansia sp. RSA 1290]
MLWPLLLCGAACLAAILQLLHSYGDRRRCAWYVQVAAAASWYLPFTIVFILPFDFSSTQYRICEHNCDAPLGYISSQFTRRLWVVLYWTMYLLTWLVLPVMMSYVDSGAFAFRDRLRDAAWSNVQFYGATGAAGMLIVGYIALTRGVFGADLVALLMALANFWGLFLVIAFMGFGLVAIPRKLWRRGDLAWELSQIESRAVAYKDQAYDAGLELAEVAAEVRAVSERVSSADDLRGCVDRVLKYCPDTARATQSFAPPRIPAEVTEAYLAKLHNRIKHVVLKEERDRWRWNRAARRAFFLQDTLMSRENPSRLLVSTMRPWSQWSLARRSAMWWWYIVLRPFVFRALAAITAVLSAAILWSELTFNTAYLSAVRYVLRALGLSYFGIEAASIVVITYMCVCAYSSVMKLRIFNIYSLESHHHTNERSLLFCGAYLCRLMFPLCYNFLGMAGSTSAGDVTEFAKFMDQIDLVPILGEQSNRVIPVLVMIPATLAFFNIHGRVMDYFSIDSISSSPEDDPELGPLCLPYEEGRALLLEARRAAEQTQGSADTQSRRRYSPSSSVYTNSVNFRSTVPDVGPASEIHASTCGPREWHLGRPSLDHLRQTAAFDPAAESPSLPAQNEPRLFASSALHKFGSSNDLYGSTNSGLAAHSTDRDAASSDSSDLDTTSPQASAARPTGMAARFVSSLHPNKRTSKLRSKVPSGWPGNFSRLRPSSRQSSLHYPVSDDGMLPPQMPTLSSNLKQPLLHSPSSPGRTANPWAESSIQARRHALSDSSIRSPKHVE